MSIANLENLHNFYDGPIHPDTVRAVTSGSRIHTATKMIRAYIRGYRWFCEWAPQQDWSGFEGRPQKYAQEYLEKIRELWRERRLYQQHV